MASIVERTLDAQYYKGQLDRTVLFVSLTIRVESTFHHLQHMTL